MDVAEEESTEDFHKFGSIQDAIINPLKAKVTHLYEKRVLWLTALVFMNVFSGAAISYFENVIESAVSLVFFLLLIGSGEMQVLNQLFDDSLIATEMCKWVTVETFR